MFVLIEKLTMGLIFVWLKMPKAKKKGFCNKKNLNAHNTCIQYGS